MSRTDSKSELQSYPLTINGRRTRSEMVAAGKYDYVDHDITDRHFPVTKGKAVVKAVLVHLDRRASDEDILVELERLGLRAATMDELCAFGEQHPDCQREYSIIALGSVWTDRLGYRYVGRLWEDAFNRSLVLAWLGAEWDANYRFLAVHK